MRRQKSVRLLREQVLAVRLRQVVAEQVQQADDDVELPGHPQVQQVGQHHAGDQRAEAS